MNIREHGQGLAEVDDKLETDDDGASQDQSLPILAISADRTRCDSREEEECTVDRPGNIEDHETKHDDDAEDDSRKEGDDDILG